MKKETESLFTKLITVPFQRINLLREFITFISGKIGNYEYEILKKKFIQNGKKAKFNEKLRYRIIEQFEYIDNNIPIMTTPTDGLFLAEAFLSMDAEGAIIECGCYAGGSTAKLSLLAKILGKNLLIFDSFEGLPDVSRNHQRVYDTRRGASNWVSGKYNTNLEQVKANVKKYGDITNCSFYKGFFNKTLTESQLPGKIACAFTDVDLVSSVKECLIAIWPRISEGGIYFSHDIAFNEVLQVFSDEDIWQKILKEFPPVIYGAGFGLCNSSPHLGFFVKRKEKASNYIEKLMITKKKVKKGVKNK